MKKKLPVTLDALLEKDPKLKKEFNEKFKKWETRPKPNPKLKIGLKYIKENFNLDLFLNKIVERGNYKFMNDGDMLDVVILNGFNQEEVTKIYDHLDDKEFDKLHKLAENDKLLSKITNF